ncbi:hypothetical protein NUACC21_65470 [Scytonema sp. NUACC21]
MLSQKAITSSIVSLGLIVGVTSSRVEAQTTHEMPHTQTSHTTQFARIEQPLWVKGAVTGGGLTLIGLEIWWFLVRKPKSHKGAKI